MYGASSCSGYSFHEKQKFQNLSSEEQVTSANLSQEGGHELRGRRQVTFDLTRKITTRSTETIGPRGPGRHVSRHIASTRRRCCGWEWVDVGLAQRTKGLREPDGRPSE